MKHASLAGWRFSAQPLRADDKPLIYNKKGRLLAAFYR